MLVGTLKLNEFVVLSERAQKMKGMQNEKKQTKSKSKDISKHCVARSFLTSSSKKMRDFQSQSFTPTRTKRRDISRQNYPRPQITSVVNTDSVRNANKPVCEHCGKLIINL